MVSFKKCSHPLYCEEFWGHLYMFCQYMLHFVEEKRVGACVGHEAPIVALSGNSQCSSISVFDYLISCLVNIVVFSV
jgi:hypothetical protein